MSSHRFTASLVAAGLAAGCGAASPRPVVSFPGASPRASAFLGVCVPDGARFVAHVDRAGDAIVARGLDDGTVLWRAEGAGHVVACDDTTVVGARVESGRLVVHLVEARAGRVRTSTPTDLVPEWARPSGDASPLTLEAWREADGWGVAWSASTSWQGGYPPSPEEEAGARHEAGGAFVLTRAGAVRRVSSAPELTATDDVSLPGSLRDTDPSGAARLVGPLVVGDLAALVTRSARGPVLHRWQVRSGHELPPRALPPGALDAVASWDRCHALLPDAQGRVRVVDLRSGDELAALDGFSIGVGTVFVARPDRLVLVQATRERPEDAERQRAIHRLEVRSADGSALWSAIVHDEEIVPGPG